MATGSRPDYFHAALEPLECRSLLSATPLINEIYFDPPASGGDLVDEYIELRGTPNSSLANTYLIFLENENNALNTGNPGAIDRIFDLSTFSFGTNGFLTLRQNGNPYSVAPGTTNLVNTNGTGWGGASSSLPVSAEGDAPAIENSGFTVMLIDKGSGATPAINDDLDTGNDGLDVATGMTGWTILDAIGIHSEFGEEQYGRLYAPINFGPDVSSNIEPGATYVAVGFEIEYVGRYGNSSGQTADDWNVSNLTDNALAGYTGTGDFRQSGDPQGSPTVVETSHGIPYGTNMTGSLGAPNYPGVAPPSSVVKTNLFYKGSTKWNVTNGATFSDDNAIAPDKTAYLPGGGTSTFAAVSSYDRGINGIMVDLSGAHGAITVNDFTFKRGNNNSPNAWVAATAPTAVTTRATAGTSGSDRIELLWADNDAVKKQWLEVIVEGNDTVGGYNTNTGLSASYVFYFGNPLGDTGTGNAGAFQVTSTDEVNARNNGKTFTATRSDVNDFNRDGSVNSSDQIIARNNITNLGNQLKFLVVGAGGPFAPESSGGGGGDSGVASGLAASSSSGSGSSASAPGWLGAQSTGSAPGSGTAGASSSTAGDPIGLIASEDVSTIDDELLDELIDGISSV
jgi:hypothetical protein